MQDPLVPYSQRPARKLRVHIYRQLSASHWLKDTTGFCITEQQLDLGHGGCPSSGRNDEAHEEEHCSNSACV